LYYYILDYVQNPKFTNFQKKLKQILTNLNIAGEMAASSPARSAEEVAQLALERGYSTIVAVGGDLLVNKIASVLAESPAALGVIPYNLSPELGSLFCSLDLKTACLGLKKRKTALTDLGVILPNKYFLSDLVIKAEKPFQTILEIDNSYALESSIYHLQVGRDLRSSFITLSQKKHSRWWQRRQIPESNITKFQSLERLNVSTASPISVTVAGFELIKTPVKVTTAKEVLKIIVNRDTIN
jgi:diacylglycerol kinase family enzyme